MTATRSRAEQVSLYVSLAILGAVVAAIIFVWYHDANELPHFTIETEEPRLADDLYYLPVTIYNGGDMAAVQVTLEGTLPTDPPEEASTTFDFVPGHTRMTGVLVFTTEPISPSIRIVSYQEP